MVDQWGIQPQAQIYSVIQRNIIQIAMAEVQDLHIHRRTCSEQLQPIVIHMAAALVLVQHQAIYLELRPPLTMGTADYQSGVINDSFLEPYFC